MAGPSKHPGQGNPPKSSGKPSGKSSGKPSGKSSGKSSAGSSGRNPLQLTPEQRKLARMEYLNVLRRIFRSKSPPVSAATNKLIEFAINQRMSATDFLYLYRSRDKNYVKSFEFKVRYREALAAARRMFGPDTKLPTEMLRKLVLSEASSQQFENRLRASKLFQKTFPGIRWDQTTADWRETTTMLNAIARQYLGRDVSRTELAMLHSQNLDPSEFERNLQFIGQTSDAMRWMARDYTPQEKQTMAFSQKLAAEIRSRGARALAVRRSFASGNVQAAPQMVRRREQEAAFQPLI